MRAVIRHDGDLMLRVLILDRANLFLLHIDGTEHEIDVSGDGIDIRDVAHRHLSDALRDRDRHLPAAFDCLAIGLSGRAGARRQAHELKPRMIRQQRYETLSDHAGGTQDTNFILSLHVFSPAIFCMKSLREGRKRGLFTDTAEAILEYNLSQSDFQHKCGNAAKKKRY